MSLSTKAYLRERWRVSDERAVEEGRRGGRDDEDTHGDKSPLLWPHSVKCPGDDGALRWSCACRGRAAQSRISHISRIPLSHTTPLYYTQQTMMMKLHM